MTTIDHVENLPFLVEKLRKDILPEFDLGWTDYLVLNTINQFENKEHQPSPQEIIATLDMNLGWISLRKSKEEGYISLWEGRAFEAGRIYMGLLGTVTLRRINATLARSIQEIYCKSMHQGDRI